MTSPSRFSLPPRTTLVRRIAALFVAFAAGWMFASLTHHPTPTPATTASASTSPALPSSSSSSSFLADAKAAFAADLKISDPLKRTLLLEQLTASLDAGAIKSILDDYTRKPLSDVEYDAIHLLVARWVKLNARSAFAWAQGLPPVNKNALLDMVLNDWTEIDPAAAVAAVAQIPPGIRSYQKSTVLQLLAEKDPQAALAAMRSLPPSHMDSGIYRSIFASWAKTDPAAASAAALNIAPGMSRIGSVNGVASAWTEKDPAAALDWANSLPAGSDRGNAVSSVIRTMSAQDPAAAAALALKLPAGTTDYFSGRYDRDSVIQSVADTWAQKDPAAVLTWADQNLNGNAFTGATLSALKQMGSTDPAAAAAAIAKLSDPGVINQAIPDLATAWAGEDAQAALVWAQSLPANNADVRQAALGNILKTMTDTDPVSAANFVASLSTDPAFGKLATQVANNWAASDPQSALAWAQSLPPGDGQNSAVIAAVSQLAITDPATAWNDAEQLSGPGRDKALSQVISHWADSQPAQAATALTTLSPGDNLDSATDEVASSWLNEDPVAATQWINTLPPGSARDEAVDDLVSVLQQSDLSSAMTWANTISDENDRNSQVVKLASQWSNSNPAAAATAAQNALSLTGLTAAQQSTLQKIVAKAPSHP